MPSVTDVLALDRTRLANERTLLAYLRTALGFAAAGGTLWRLFPGEPIDRGFGACLVIVGATLLVVGVLRFVAEHRRYVRLRAELG